MKLTLIYLTLLLTTTTATLTAQLVEIGNNSRGDIKVYGGEWTWMPDYEEIEQTAQWSRTVHTPKGGQVRMSEWSDFPNKDTLRVDLDGKTNLVIVYEGVVNNIDKKAIAFLPVANYSTKDLWVFFKAWSPQFFYAVTSFRELNYNITTHTHPHWW